MTTRFGPWYPMADAARAAPAGAGVYQVKLPRVIDYPSGKSAMILYGAGADVRAALVALADAHPGEPWLCRHEASPHAAEAGALLADLVTRFRRRFGAEPGLPAASAGEVPPAEVPPAEVPPAEVPPAEVRS